MRYFVFIAFVLFAVQVNAQESAPRKIYGNNIMSASAVVNNGGIGFGLQYECLIDKKTTFILPAGVCFSTITSTYSGHGGTSGPEELQGELFFIEPGFRYYPAKTKGVARYCLGANMMIGVGKGASAETYSNHAGLQTRFIFGFLFANAINFQFSRHIRATLETDFGLGADNNYNKSTLSHTNSFLGQLSFAIGYRW